MSKARAKKIRLFLFDVDGVMTDGKIWIFPAPAGVPQSSLERGAAAGASTQSLIEAKGFHAHDGTGITLLQRAGIKTGLITKRRSETVALRARDLRVDFVYQGIQDKRGAFEEILAQEKIAAEDAVFVGDDVIDLPVMRVCGLAIAVKNARPEVKRAAHYVTPHGGGDGGLRDAVEYVLKAQGRWTSVFEAYIAERNPAAGPQPQGQ
jgi:3-deoxy-D-manno-octulosonate 8-phosphate phosphatase (KDO 8-P phosphatase)